MPSEGEGVATLLIDHQRSIERALFTLSLSTAKFPKVRRGAQRHSATAFVRFRSPRGSVPFRRKRPWSSRHENDLDFCSRASCEAKKSEEKKRKNLRTLARPLNSRFHRSTASQAAGFAVPGLSSAEKRLFLGCATRGKETCGISRRDIVLSQRTR